MDIAQCRLGSLVGGLSRAAKVGKDQVSTTGWVDANEQVPRRVGLVVDLIESRSECGVGPLTYMNAVPLRWRLHVC